MLPFNLNIFALSKEEKLALHLLAIRNKHYLDYDLVEFSSSSWLVLISKKFTCLVCNNVVDGSMIKHHGLDHLKQYKLLPFI